MASLKFENGKCHGATAAKALMRHNDIDPERRKIAAKENPNIDVTKSHLNKSLLGLSYEQKCEKYDRRIEELDTTTNKNKRKDRVTLQGIEVPAPEGLPRNCYNKFFINVAKILIDEVGSENFIDGDIHHDEEHDYIDAETHELTTSRVHAHFGVVPAYNGQLKAQKLYSRATMRRLNKKVDEMTQREFGIKFMTGTKQKSKKTIDELKNESSRLALEQREQKCEQRENAVLEAENGILQRENEVDRREQALEQKAADLLKYEQIGLEYFSRAKNLCSSLEREEKEFRDNKAKLYSQSLDRIDNLRTKLDESLLPQPHRSKQKERSL